MEGPGPAGCPDERLPVGREFLVSDDVPDEIIQDQIVRLTGRRISAGGENDFPAQALGGQQVRPGERHAPPKRDEVFQVTAHFPGGGDQGARRQRSPRPVGAGPLAQAAFQGRLEVGMKRTREDR